MRPIISLLIAICTLTLYTLGVWKIAVVTKENNQETELHMLKIDYENCQWSLLKRNAENSKLMRQIDSLRNDELDRYKYIESRKL